MNSTDTDTFERRVDEITEAIRASDPEIAGAIQCSRTSEMAEWELSGFRATLILHLAEERPRLSLQLSNGTDEHPAALQIGFDDPDVVNMIAVPAAAHLTGTSEP